MAETEPTVDREKGLPEIVHTEDVLGGDPRIEGRRIGVRHVYRSHVQAQESPAEIAERYELSLAEVHAALAYAFTNPNEMEALERRNREIAEATASMWRGDGTRRWWSRSRGGVGSRRSSRRGVIGIWSIPGWQSTLEPRDEPCPIGRDGIDSSGSPVGGGRRSVGPRRAQPNRSWIGRRRPVGLVGDRDRLEALR